MFAKNELIVVSIDVFSGSNPAAQKMTVPGRHFHSLTFRQSGKMTIETENQKLISGPNSVTYIPQGYTYDTEVLKDSFQQVIHFNVLENPKGLKPMVIYPTYPVVLHNLIKALNNCYLFTNAHDYLCMSLLYEILAEISMEKKICGPVPKRIQEAKDYIDTHFAETISITDLAHKANVSEPYFRREFKKCYSCAPSTYLKNIRLHNAKMMLDAGYYSISEIALQSGFHSASYMSHEFFIKNGLTPRDYQKKQKNQYIDSEHTKNL